MRILGLFDDFNHFLKQKIDLRSILVLSSRVQYETHPFKGLDPPPVLSRHTREVTAGQCDLVEVLEICLVVLVHGHYPVYDAGPVFKGVTTADKKVIFVKNAKHFAFYLTNKQHSSFFQ